MSHQDRMQQYLDRFDVAIPLAAFTELRRAIASVLAKIYPDDGAEAIFVFKKREP